MGGMTRYGVRVGAAAAWWLTIALAAFGQPGTYAIDAEATTIRFTARHMGVLTVGGRFDDVAGTITVTDGAPREARLTIGAASVDTGNRMRDRSLRSDTFLDADAYPVITFASDRVVRDASGFSATGHLSLHGVTRTLTVPFTFSAAADALHIEAAFVLNRRDFGLTFGPAMDTLVGDEIRMEAVIVARVTDGELRR